MQRCLRKVKRSELWCARVRNRNRLNRDKLWLLQGRAAGWPTNPRILGVGVGVLLPDGEVAGMYSNTSNSFSILNSCDDVFLENFASDCDISLGVMGLPSLKLFLL